MNARPDASWTDTVPGTDNLVWGDMSDRELHDVAKQIGLKVDPHLSRKETLQEIAASVPDGWKWEG